MAELQKEDVLWRLLTADSPDAAISIFIAEKNARTPALIDRLGELEQGEWVASRERIQAVMRLIQNTHKLIHRFSHVDNLSDLASAAQSHWLCWSFNFKPLIQVSIFDASREGDTARAERLKNALRVYELAFELIERLNKLQPRRPMDLKTHPELMDPGFLEFLRAMAQHERSNEASKESTTHIEQVIEHLESSRRAIAAYDEFHKQLRDGTEQVKIRIPTSPERSELWFFPPSQLFSRFEQLAGKVKDREIELTVAARDAADLSTGLYDPTNPFQNNRDSLFAWGGTAFCAFLINTSPTLAFDCLQQFRALLDAPIMHRISTAERISYVLRYAMLLAPNYLVVPEPRLALEDAFRLLNAVEPQANAKTNPRLRRDILFFRARIRRELSRWDPPQVIGAIEDFKKGLAIEGAKYEREARGRALGDLASALTHAPPGVRATDAELVAIYEEALQLLTEFPIGLATVLIQLAQFYNERTEGVRSENQEFALRYINQGIDSLRSMELPIDAGVYVKQIQATLELTKGNILRRRSPGDPEQRRQLSIQSYHRALRILPAEGFDRLRGEIRLNLGYAYLEGEPKQGEAEMAMQHLDEAMSLLQTSPDVYGLVSIARAEVWFFAPSGGRAAWWDQMQAVERARRIYLESRDLVGLGKACWMMARLQTFDGHRSRFRMRRATQHLAMAAENFESQGEISLAIEVLEEYAAIQVDRSSLELEQKNFHLFEARAAIKRALQHVAHLKKRSDHGAWRRRWSERNAWLSTHLIWLEANLGTDATELWSLAQQAKANEMSQQLAEIKLRAKAIASGDERARATDESRRLALIYEADFIRNQDRSPPESDRSDAIRGTHEALDEYRQELIALELRAVASPVLSIGTATPGHSVDVSSTKRILCDINVSKWGTVVLWAGHGLPPHGAKSVIPLHLGQIDSWLYGDKNETGWLNAYANRSADPKKWKESTRSLIQQVNENLWEPSLDSTDLSLEGTRLLISPGVLGGIPLHACAPRGKRLVDTIEGLAWVPKPELVEVDTVLLQKQKVLCILSDPIVMGSDRLDEAPGEITSFATTLAQVGADVTLLASADIALGRAVFERRSLMLPSNVQVLEQRPTPEWMQEHLHEFDLIFYAGHGMAGGEHEPELLLVDEAGRMKSLRLLDLLSAKALDRKPLVLLSACETAHEGMPSPGEQFSLASGFLRLGAHSVVGTLWVVNDKIAAKYSKNFCTELAAGVAYDIAFVKAVRSNTENDETAWATFCYWLTPFPT